MTPARVASSAIRFDFVIRPLEGHPGQGRSGGMFATTTLWSSRFTLPMGYPGSFLNASHEWLDKGAPPQS
jgi:hypothetical protein